MLLSKQASDSIYFLQEGNIIILIYTKYSRAISTCQKKTIRNISTITFLTKTLSDIRLLFHDMVGLDVYIQEWAQPSRKASKSGYDYLQ